MGKKDRTILVVEDNEPMRRILRKFLCSMGFKDIIEAEDGGTALCILKSQELHVVIADLDIPGPNGFELLHWVRSNEATRKLPFLIVTGECQEYFIRKAAAEGANGYLTKPFNKATLAEHMERMLVHDPAAPSIG